MGAYENPNVNVGVDNKSGLLEAQGIQGFAQGIAKGVSAYGTAMAKQKLIDDKVKQANRVSLAEYNEKAVKQVQNVINQADKSGTDVVDTTLGNGFYDLARESLAPILRENDLFPNGINFQKNKDKLNGFKTGIGDVGFAAVGMTELSEFSQTGGADMENSTPGLLQTLPGNDTKVNSIVRMEGNNLIAKTIYSSAAIQKINEAEGKKGNTLEVDLTNMKDIGLNPNIYGSVTAGIYATKPYAINSFVAKHVKEAPITNNSKSASNQIVINGKNNETYSRTYESAELLVTSAENYAKGEAAALLSQYSGNLPANAYYNKLKESGTILERSDGSMYMMVPGSINEKTKVKTFHLTDEQLRNSSGDFKNGPENFIEMDVPKITIDPTGKDSKKLGLNLYTQEGFDGLVNVIKYQTLKERGWTNTTKSKEPISKISNVNSEGGLGNLLAAEIEAIDIVDIGTSMALSGLTTKKQAETGTFQTKENIRKHREYLDRYGIRTKTKPEMIKSYKDLIGTKSSDGQTYTKEIVDGFIEDLGKYILFDAQTNEPFSQYTDPYTNEGIKNIMAKKIGITLKSRETLLGSQVNKDLDVD